jgi:primosomal protein N' (replication factor Y)
MSPVGAAGVLRVAVEAPQHSGLGGALDYLSDRVLAPGTLLRVPLGKRDLLGIVWHGAPAPASGYSLRSVGEVFDDLPPLAPAWLALADFAAGYYQRGVCRCCRPSCASSMRPG